MLRPGGRRPPLNESYTEAWRPSRRGRRGGGNGTQGVMIVGSAAASGVALPGVEDNLLPEPTVGGGEVPTTFKWVGVGRRRQEVLSVEAATPCTGLQQGSEARWAAGTLRAGRGPPSAPHRGLCAGGGVLTGHSLLPREQAGGPALSGTQDTCGPCRAESGARGAGCCCLTPQQPQAPILPVPPWTCSHSLKQTARTCRSKVRNAALPPGALPLSGGHGRPPDTLLSSKDFLFRWLPARVQPDRSP